MLVCKPLLFNVGHPGLPVKRHETGSGLYVIEYNDVANKIRFMRF